MQLRTKVLSDCAELLDLDASQVLASGHLVYEDEVITDPVGELEAGEVHSLSLMLA